jgi:hypothetical protein
LFFQALDRETAMTTTPKRNPIAQAAAEASGTATAKRTRRGRMAIQSGKSKTHFNFNEEAMALLSGPKASSDQKSIEFTDEGCIGLKAEFGRSGQGTYRFRYTSPTGGKRGMRVGTVGAMPLHEARQIVMAARASLDRGIDPQDERDRLRTAPTLEEWVRQEYLPWAELNKRSWRDDVSRYENHIAKRWGSKRLIDITSRDVEKLKGEMLKSHAAGTANRLLTLVSAIYREAIKHDVVSITAVRLKVEQNQLFSVT